MYGEPLRGLRLLGGLTLLDAKRLIPRRCDRWQTGNWCPCTQADAGVEWDVPGAFGLTLTGRAVYTGSQHADAANTHAFQPGLAASWARVT